MILIPIKDLSRAKQRLASILDQPPRTELAQAMLADILDAVRSSAHQEAAVVTSDTFAIDLAKTLNLEVIFDRENVSETAAIEMATRICEERGIESSLVIPGDIPLITAAELNQIFAGAPKEGSVLVPAADGRGTNAAFRRPAGLFPLRFGNDSFQPHLAAAKATGKTCVVLSLPGIALDVDRPDDLYRFSQLPGETRAQRLIRSWNLADLPAAANQ